MTLALTWLGFFIAGLAGSLHCIGMCGPILTAIAGIQRPAEITVNGVSISQTTRRAAGELLWYHAGRVSTYALLGAVAGALGAGLREALWLGQIQNWLGVGAGVLAIVVGIALLFKPVTSCAGVFESGAPSRSLSAITALLRGLAQQNSPTARFLLGAVMGFIPCGLVYVMLAAVSATGNPLAAALGMIAFGLGTVPALTGVVLAVRLIPIRWRRHGHQAGMLMAVVVGSVFLWRSWPTAARAEAPLSEAACPLCSDAPTGVEASDQR